MNDATEANVVPDISPSEYYMGRDKLFAGELSDAHKMNAERTIVAANAILELFGQKRRVTSGWRPASINAATKGAALHSRHVLCQAIDLEDNDKALINWCLNNQDKLAEVGVWMEDPRDTPTWVHWQIVPPASGHRIFRA
jgi:Peptidase M15